MHDPFANAYPGVPGRQDLGHPPRRCAEATTTLPWVRLIDSRFETEGESLESANGT